jgi:hypothetical protein
MATTTTKGRRTAPVTVAVAALHARVLPVK